jgi:hypothetical protein
LLLLGAAGASYGAQAGKGVTVTIPAYGVTMNGVRIDNSYIKYPFIVYKDITYFPMTYNDCRFLGLETEWKGNTAGLSIEKPGITAAYLPQKASAKNGSRYQANVPGFPIKVNGKAVDNSKQDYPLLSFRDITYFPMTWEFGVKEFGWDYSFDGKNGLAIRSDNIKLDQKAIAKGSLKKGTDGVAGTVTVTDRYAYYEDNKGRIIQAPLADLSKTKTVYQLPVWSYGDGGLVSAGLRVDKGTAYLTYHQGGATMGADFLIRLNDDGTTTELQNSYTRTKTFGDKSFFYWTGGAPGPGNLFQKTGADESKPLGDQGYIYGWAWTSGENSSGGSGTDDVYLVGDDLYILAFPTKQDGGKNGIYKININTNETTRLSKREALAFQLEGDFLYYQNEGSLYRTSIKDGTEELVVQMVKNPNFVSEFAVLNGKVYWQDGLNHNLYNAAGENVNFGAALDDMKLMGDNEEYLVCTFQETELSKYRIMIFDKAGKVVFKTSDKAYGRNIFIKGSTVYFYNITAGTICVGTLNN